MNDTLINKPPHYTHSNIEPLDVIHEWNLSFYLGNVIKYIARHKHKGAALEDLKKARFYLDKEISSYLGEEEDSLFDDESKL